MPISGVVLGALKVPKPVPVKAAEEPTKAPSSPAKALEPVPPTQTPSNPKVNGSEAYAVLAAMEKDKGRKLWMTGNKIPQAERIPTGLYDIDLAIGGGFPRGRIVILYGKEGSLKTTLALKAAAVLQKQKRPDNKAVLVDVEGTYAPDWGAKSTGVDNEQLLVAKPGYAEEAVDMVDALVHAEDVGLIIVDSIGVFANAKELEKSSEDRQQGGSAWVVNAMVRKIIWGFAAEAPRGHHPCVILINHPRIAVGPVPVEWMPGGKLQLTQSALTLKLNGKKVVEKAVDPLNPTWHHTEVEVKKAKVGVTRHAFDFDLCLIAHEKLKVGQTDTWNTVSAALKAFGFLEKVGVGWKLSGKTYPTLVPIAERYQSDHAFQLELQQRVTAEAMKNQFVVG